MADFMKVDMSRLGQAEGRSADSGMAAPSGADVDTFQQAMRRRPLDERQGSGGDESDGGRGASHAPDEDTSAEAEALSSMFSRMAGPLDTLFAGRTAQTAETAAPSGDARFGCAGGKARGADSGFRKPDGGHEIRLTLGKMSSRTEIRLQRGATACCRYIWRRTTRHPFRPSSAHRNGRRGLSRLRRMFASKWFLNGAGRSRERRWAFQSRGEYVVPDERDA